jgi:hypothetical protein
MIGPDLMLVRRDNDVVESQLEKRVVLFSMRDGLCFEFNAIAAKIWRSLGAPCSISRLLDSLARDYSVERAVLERDVSPFLDQLLRKGLLRIVPAAS